MADKNQQWRELTEQILDAIDIIEEYKSFGVKFAGDVRPNGCAACYAIGREDRNPSAFVKVSPPGRGNYYDSGGSGERIRFFDFAARFGPYADWREARKQYAVKTKLWRKLPKTDEDPPPDERIGFKEWPEAQFRLMTRGLVEKYPGITVDALIANSTTREGMVTVATYPKRSPCPTYCVCLPAYGPGLYPAGPTGYVIMATNGDPLPLYKGPEAPPEMQKRLCLGTGIVGRHAIMRLSERVGGETATPINIVWKMEGISDLLAQWSLIPRDKRDTDLVLSNASGATEVFAPSQFVHVLSGLNVAVVGDCDEAGQKGAEVWVKLLTGKAKVVRALKLPFEVVEKHGRDFRDWACGAA